MTEIEHGGLSWTTSLIGGFLSLNGVWIILVQSAYVPFARRFGARRAVVVGYALYLPALAMLPLTNRIARHAPGWLWPCMIANAILLVFGGGFAFTSSNVLVRYSLYYYYYYCCCCFVCLWVFNPSYACRQTLLLAKIWVVESTVLQEPVPLCFVLLDHWFPPLYLRNFCFHMWTCKVLIINFYFFQNIYIHISWSANNGMSYPFDTSFVFNLSSIILIILIGCAIFLPKSLDQ